MIAGKVIARWPRSSEGRTGDAVIAYVGGAYHLCVKTAHGWMKAKLLALDSEEKAAQAAANFIDGDLTVTGKLTVGQDAAVSGTVSTSQLFRDSYGRISGLWKLAPYVTPNYFPAPMQLIRNVEQNNLLSTASGTEIVVSSVNTGTSTVYVNWLPYISSLINPQSGKEWALMNLEKMTGSPDPATDGDYTHICKVLAVNYGDKALLVQSCRGSLSEWSAGDKLALYNPFVGGLTFDPNIVLYLGTKSWNEKWIGPNAIFRRSDGKWCMLVVGCDYYNAYRVGAVASDDLETWSWLNDGDPIFVNGSKWWCSQCIQVTSVLRIPGEDFLLGYACGYDGSKWRISYVKFKEDFSLIQYADSEIIDSSGWEGGLYGPSVVRYGSRYYMLYFCRTANYASSAWKDGIAGSSSPFGTFTSHTYIHTGLSTNDGIYYSSHPISGHLLVWRDRLYAFVAGTSRYRYSATRANACYGLCWLEQAESLTYPYWRDDPRSPVLISPWYGNDIWGYQYGWCCDHLGGVLSPVIDPETGKMHLFHSAKGTVDYCVSKQVLDIESVFDAGVR